MPLINDEYILRFLDKNGNVLVEADFNSLYKDKIFENFEMNEENQNKLISFINDNIPIDLGYVKTKLNEYIGYNEKPDYIFKFINLEDIIDNIKDINYERVVLSNNGRIYALVNTSNSDTLEIINDYFKNNYEGYKRKSLNNDFYVFVYSDLEYNLDDLR